MYQRGDRWYSDFCYQGKRYKKSWGHISKTVATEKDRKFRVEVAEGKHILRSKQIMFEIFSNRYLEYAKLNKKPKSATRNEVSINMLMPYFKGKLLGSIHPFLVEQYKKMRKGEGRAPATINRDIACLKNMLNKAVEWGYLSQNPIRSVKLLKEDNERMWVLIEKEETKLLEECEQRPQRKKYLKDLVLVALHSGMREAEIFNLSKTNVNLEKRFILVTDTKNNENRRVPINDTLKEVLERWMKDSGSEYVFCNVNGKKLTVLTNAFWKAVKKAGLIRVEVRNGDTEEIRFRFHDLRHTFGSRLGMAGVDLKTIMEIMGIKSHKVAMRYLHPAPEHKLKAVKILDGVPPLSTPEKIVDLKFLYMLNR